ncbi:MAG: helix-turn-helix transcriptional regulator [Roseburia sp.]|nr:helix-turn-helix transcriptional regulator [Roseburia sp.]
MESKPIIDMKKTGKKLQSFAECYGYSVKDIQHYLELSCPQPVYRWYKGIILPSIDNLLRLSELFHVHMEELLVKENERFEYALDCTDPVAFKNRMAAYYVRMVA